MHRRGHVGVAMLAYAPVGFLLLREGRLGIALLGLLGVLAVEPLPDNDMWIPGLNHRGTSHSLFAALVVGAVLGALGWIVGDQLGAALVGLDSSMVGPFAGVFEIVGEALRGLDERALARFGFAVGVFGIIAHLLGDVITVSGIRPLLPLSHWRISLSRLHADNSLANNALFGVGAVALVAIALTTAPVGLAAPADISPVGTASAQSTTPTANASNATVELDSSNNTTAANVTIAEATLPNGGFVVLHGEGFAEGATLRGSEIAASGYLKPGTHRDLTLPVKQGVPGGSNVSQLNLTKANLSLVAYQDTNNDSQFGYIASRGRNDTPYKQSGQVVADTETVTFEGNIEKAEQSSQTEPATVVFNDQQVRQNTLTVKNATLPKGGFVVVHEGYQPPNGDPLGSAIGLSGYLKSGTHRNVTVTVLNGSINKTQTITAVPYLDTNGNQSYDYVTSGGEADVAYLNRTGSQATIPNDTAVVSAKSDELTDDGDSNDSDTSSGIDDSGRAATNTSTPFRLTNLSVNRTAHVDDDITITAEIENPTDSRLEGEIVLATAGEIAEEQEVALFPQESRTVTFTHTYDSSGEYVVKVGNRTKHIRIVEEGESLTTPTPTPSAGANNSSVKSNSNVTGLGDVALPAVAILVVVGGGYALYRRRQQGGQW
jgi:membrane-bound metal-dependent hydrolase YbcI (DUF457 family)